MSKKQAEAQAKRKGRGGSATDAAGNADVEVTTLVRPGSSGWSHFKSRAAVSNILVVVPPAEAPAPLPSQFHVPARPGADPTCSGYARRGVWLR